MHLTLRTKSMHIILISNQIIPMYFLKRMIFSIKLYNQYLMSVVLPCRESALYGDVYVVGVRVKE